MSFVEYNTNNVGTFLGTVSLMSTWVIPKTVPVATATCQDRRSVAAQDTEVKRLVAATLPPSPTKKHTRSRATTVLVSHLPSSQTTTKAKVQFKLIDITNSQKVTVQVANLKPLLKKTEHPKAYAEEIPVWWSPNLPSLTTTAEANIGLDANFDRALVYEYVREMRDTKRNYQEKIDIFLPKRLKGLLNIIQDTQFQKEIKQFNSMINDSHIKCVETSFELARFNSINQRFR